jgi:UDP-N-acetylmuramoyl-tripeptide--D-alanyl-D-alanine ligase
VSAADCPLWSPVELVAAVEGTALGPPSGPILGVSIDSRSLAAGDLFVALSGPNADGHDHVGSALTRGAAAALVARDLPGLPEAAPVVRVDDTQKALERLGAAGRARSAALVTAVTGSVGKTTTKEMLAGILATQAKTHWSVASYNNQWGVPLSLARLPLDARFGVFELGMNHAGEIAALTHQTRPDVAIITTIEPAHLEFFGSIEAIADAKAEIFAGMTGEGTAILNRDNPMFDRLAAAARRVGQVLAFGTGEDTDLRLIACAIEPDGSQVEAMILGRNLSFRLGQPGRHLVMNSLAVLGAAAVLGADLDAAAETLATLPGLAGRGRQQRIGVGTGAATLIDESYNASPAAMRAAFAVLGAARPGPGGRRIAVLGDMRELGAEAPALHAGLAPDLVASGADLVFTAGTLMQALHDSLPPALAGAWRPSAQELLPVIVEMLKPGDVVTVKGSLGSRMADIVKPLIAGAAQLPAG